MSPNITRKSLTATLNASRKMYAHRINLAEGVGARGNRIHIYESLCALCHQTFDWEGTSSSKCIRATHTHTCTVF